MATNTVAFVIGIFVALGLSMHTPEAASASPYTPLEWQQEVPGDHPLGGQRKNVAWIRNRGPRDFIDDEIQARYQPGEPVNVVVDLNTCLTRTQIRDLLSSFGQIKYIGKLITSVLLDAVPFTKLPEIAALPQVAMIEWQAPLKTMDDVSSRAIQSQRSRTYSPGTAQDLGWTGKHVNIAIIDTGVDNRHAAFTGKFVTGCDFTIATPATPCPPVLPNTNNDTDQFGHGTHVAGVALGRAPPFGFFWPKCRIPQDDNPRTNCSGVAIDAGLVDLKVCKTADDCSNVMQGLDWLGENASTYNIRVANISLAWCKEDYDGSSWMAQQVNYLVSLGVVIVAAHGNRSRCNYGPTDPVHPQLTSYPGSASFAITVQGIRDGGTVVRTDDILYNEALLGPRQDAVSGIPLLGLKPDLSAPAEYIWSAKKDTLNEYVAADGTSAAAAHVAGAAAILIQARPLIDPGSLKDLLKHTADSSRNGSNGSIPPFAADPAWVPDFGSGIVNIFCALRTTYKLGGESSECGEPLQTLVDVRFPNCVGPPITPGGNCEVTSPHQPWDNSLDIATTPASLHVGVPTTITAQVENRGLVPATVLVNFGVYHYAVGNNQFHHIGSVQVTIPPNTTVSVPKLWTPDAEDHNCIQVSINYWLDSIFYNNVTQLNLQVAPSAPSGLRVLREVRIENPFMASAQMEIRTKSNREGWICTVNEEAFVLDPFEDCPRKVKVAFDAPPEARPGERADCDIAVYATPKGAKTPVLIGGVTARTFVPKR